MKKVFSLCVSLMLLLAVLSACADKTEPSSSNNASGGGGKSQEKKVITVLQLKREIVDQLKEMATEYQKTHPNIEFQFLGGQDDYNTALKSAFASGNAPDVFTNNGDADAVLWKDRMVDLSNEPWVKDMVEIAKPPITVDGKIYGMPYNIEGFGYIYNKDLFEKAGIKETPKTLSELEEVAKKLKAAGITAFVNAWQENFTMGKQGFNAVFARQEDPRKWMEDLNNGKVTFKGNGQTEDYMKLLDLNKKYGNKDAMTTDYNTSMAKFVAGEGAIIQQGSWTQPVLDQMGSKLNLGMFPIPINDDVKANEEMFAFAGNYWSINKDSKVIPEVKEWLNWLVTDPAGQKYIVEKFKFIPAFTNIKFTNEQLGPLATALTAYTDKGLSDGRYYNMLPSGYEKEFGSIFQAYVADKLTKEQTLEKLDEAMNTLRKQ
ncbi:raffinose/stachyose/melibiose transport system substrate-binding protein [Bacillus sp. SLBN-46]|uniref:ABC transporter substrate-binding protein n=1 Tax=Bacillus sp. SLBN-46 TaxID=3042283 RepID=UPI00285ADDE8|nr:ABC transporter substrate-binding protein [Bacillus sp. SLBN-46]MDR6124037.1 raffinose/stachyose/melibiose transport system substrate-binding protein [Bacillus sp. SLBN-46]